MTRLARRGPVFFVEEPEYVANSQPRLKESCVARELIILTPQVPTRESLGALELQRNLVARKLQQLEGGAPVMWFYTPMATQFIDTSASAAVVYDCMDELSAFRGAPAQLRECEKRLFAIADVVFTGGLSLYEAKRPLHVNVHPFPSAVDVGHFGKARLGLGDPRDQAGIPHPRIGFFGVLDERTDFGLIARIAKSRPDWQLILLGPLAKIDPESLPRAANIHYLGPKEYQQLPAYLSNWSVAMMPFALNEATKFISPTKTPEFLAGGKPVVSTPIKDVIQQWGRFDAVKIAASPDEFTTAIDEALQIASGTDLHWRAEIDRVLAHISWDKTCSNMARLVEAAVAARREESKFGAGSFTPMIGEARV